MTRFLPSLLVLALSLALRPAAGQTAPKPETAPLPPPIAAPADTPYPGTLTLEADITDTAHHVIAVHETIPVTGAGDLILLYPKWIPGNHGPTGPLPRVAGLTFSAAGRPLAWQRDPVEVYAYHVAVPAGVTRVDAAFDYLSPPGEREGRVEMTPEMVDLAWNEVLLYPAGHYGRDIQFAPSVVLPTGWHFGTALTPQGGSAARVRFAPTSLTILIDSPLLAGSNFKRVDLDPGGSVPVHLDIAADRPADLVIDEADLAAHRALVKQAYANFGAHHYDHYDFLFALSDELGGQGLEHHRSSEDATGPDYFTDRKKSLADRDLLCHEFTHSWNGKFRRPADLFSPDFTIVPERDSLLWVYEGQTQYWGQVLAARSGILTAAEVRDYWAYEAALMQNEVGRDWRDLADTTNDPIIDMRRPVEYGNEQRGEDYYLEGLLMWLDADTLIRADTGGRASLTDFARRFFGIDNGAWGVATYTFADVVAALDATDKRDWAAFLNAHLHTHDATHLLDGLSRGGWKLVFTPEQSDFTRAEETRRHVTDLRFSVGLVLGKENTIAAVAWGSPAFAAGLAPDGTIVGVDGRAYTGPEDLTAAITAAAGAAAPIDLLVRYGKHLQTAHIAWHGGLRYPHLERSPGTPDRIDAILAPLP